MSSFVRPKELASPLLATGFSSVFGVLLSASAGAPTIAD